MSWENNRSSIDEAICSELDTGANSKKQKNDLTIGVLNHNSCIGSDKLLEKTLAAIEEIKSKNLAVDILMGPDYGLVTAQALEQQRPNTMHERYNILREVKKLSKLISETTLMIGTMFWHEKKYKKEEDKAISPDKTSVSMSIYKNGRLINELFKERNNTEVNDTQNYANLINRNIVYSKGNNKNNSLTIENKKIAVQICGDHGTQNTKGCDLELIHAYDSKAGFYINSANDSWSRYALVCDGYSGTSTAQYFDSKLNKIYDLEFTKHSSLDTITLDFYKNK